MSEELVELTSSIVKSILRESDYESQVGLVTDRGKRVVIDSSIDQSIELESKIVEIEIEDSR